MSSIAEATARLNIWEGAVRSSKTVASLVRWIEYVKTAPPGPLLMVGKTERSLRRNILGPLSDIVGARRYRLNSGTGELRLCDRLVYLAGANDERAEQKIRGLTLAGAYGDELTLWPESFFVMLLSRMSVDGAMLFGTTNPDSPRHWLKRQFLDRQDELDLRSWHFELADNLSLSQSYIDALTAEYTGLWRKRFVEGLWVQAEGAVYDMFDPEVHCTREDPPECLRTYVGVDYGTTNPTVALLAVETAEALVVTHELRMSGVTDLTAAERLKAWLEGLSVQPRWIFIDPSAASFRLQCYASGLRQVAPADNEVIGGIRRTASLLSAGRLLIHARCEDLISEMTGYVWDAKATERGVEAPVKADEHSCDAIRYIVNGTRGVWARWMKAAA